MPKPSTDRNYGKRGGRGIVTGLHLFTGSQSQQGTPQRRTGGNYYYFPGAIGNLHSTSPGTEKIPPDIAFTVFKRNQSRQPDRRIIIEGT
jgi:hypothetical protein